MVCKCGGVLLIMNEETANHTQKRLILPFVVTQVNGSNEI